MIGEGNMIEVKGVVVNVKGSPTAVFALHANNPVYPFCNSFHIPAIKMCTCAQQPHEHNGSIV